MAKKTNTGKGGRIAHAQVSPSEDVVDIEAMLAGLDAVEVLEEHEDEELSALTAELDIELGVTAIDEAALEKAANSADLEDQKKECYAEQEVQVVDAGSVPATPEGSEAEVTDKKAKKAKSPKAAKEPKAAKPPKAAKEPKPAKVPHVSMVGKKTSEIVTHKLGANTADMMIWATSDVTLSAAELTKLQDERLALLDTMPVKAQNKIRYIFNFLAGNAKLQEYVRRAFVTLAKDGEITTGKDGNYVKAMTDPAAGEKPFGLGTALSQVAQWQTLFPAMLICTKEKGKLVVNPNSTIFAAVKGRLGL